MTRWTYDANNRITSKTDQNGGTTSYTFNQFGQALATTDPLGRVTTNVYDVRGNLTKVVDGDGKVTTYAHNSTAMSRASSIGTSRRWVTGCATPSCSAAEIGRAHV